MRPDENKTITLKTTALVNTEWFHYLHDHKMLLVQKMTLCHFKHLNKQPVLLFCRKISLAWSPLLYFVYINWRLASVMVTGYHLSYWLVAECQVGGSNMNLSEGKRQGKKGKRESKRKEAISVRSCLGESQLHWGSGRPTSFLWSWQLKVLILLLPWNMTLCPSCPPITLPLEFRETLQKNLQNRDSGKITEWSFF